MFKMIVTDLDGTLLNEKRKPSEETKQYLMNLKRQGYIIVIATGRMYTSILDATDGAIFANYLISDTGACTYKISGETIFQNLISKDIVRKILDYYNDDFRYIDICDKTTIYRYSKITSSKTDFIKIITEKEELLKNNLEVCHISIAMNTNEKVLELYDKLLQNFPELEVLMMQDSFKSNKWIEMTVKGCSKYWAIKNLANYLNISNEEIIAFGDGLNDIDMIRNCGYGVAMKNALPEVKKIANDITFLDHNHDGVVEYLKNVIEKAD